MDDDETGDAMTFGDLPRKPNILLIMTDQEREVMHWPAG
jgi:choline-sulfatase